MPKLTRNQLLRLLDETNAVLTVEQQRSMAVSMDLNPEAVATRLAMATDHWERIKDLTATDQKTKLAALAFAAAAEDIESAAALLDRSEQPCASCGTNRKNNWPEFQMATELDAVVRKLRNFAKQLITQ